MWCCVCGRVDTTVNYNNKHCRVKMRLAVSICVDLWYHCAVIELRSGVCCCVLYCIVLCCELLSCIRASCCKRLVRRTSGSLVCGVPYCKELRIQREKIVRTCLFQTRRKERERERENIILSIYRFRRGPGARERLLGTVIRERGLGMFMPAVLGPVATIESWSVVRDPPVRVIEPDLNCIIASYNFT